MHTKFTPVVMTLAVLATLTNLPIAHAALGYTATVENTPGLLAYYQFNTTGSSVNGYTGSLTTGASLGGANTGPALADDPTNPALLLDGTDGNELQSSLTSGVSTSGSIAAWINLAQLPSVANRYFYVAGESDNGDDFDLQVQNDNEIHFYTDSGGNVASAALTASDLNTWIFVVATFTANTDRSLYIDGVLAASNTPGGHSDSGNAFTIGYSNVFGGRAFDGAIDEVAFFNTDLSAPQVADLYASSTVAASTPEPASLALLALGLLTTFPRRKRK